MIGAIDPRRESRRIALEILGRGLGAAKSPVGAPRRVLVIRPDHLGDLLFLTPALRRLREGLPGVEIVALVGPWGQDVLGTNPNLDRLILWDFPWFNRQPRRSALAPYVSLAKLANVLRGERFDVAIQFRADFWWGALAVRCANIPEQVGFAAPAVRPYLSRAVPLRHGLHAAHDNARLVETLVGSGDRIGPLEFPVAETSRRRAAELLGDHAARRPVVALQVGAGAPVKVWPLDRLAEVGRAIQREYGGTIAVIGGASEVSQVRQVARAVGPGALELGGRTTIGELAAVLERCDLVVGPDSGPLHLAVAVETPTVHLFGPADPRRFGPFGDPRRHVVVQSSRACAPCHRLDYAAADLPEHPCLSEIGVDEVVRVAKAVLDRSRERGQMARLS